MGNFSRIFLFACIVFVIVGIVIDKITVFLPIGIALIYSGVLVIGRSHKWRNNEQVKRPE